jgi:hypothetical protein
VFCVASAFASNQINSVYLVARLRRTAIAVNIIAAVASNTKSGPDGNSGIGASPQWVNN